MTTVSVTDDNFDTAVLKSSKPIVVDFWAEWCGPCKQIGPILDELDTELSEQLTIAKFNIDDNPEVPGKYNVRAIPTLLLFNNGKVLATKMGVEPKNKLIEWVN